MPPDVAPPPLVFLGGMPRSGTTLLARMVGAHPEVAMLGETHLLLPLVDFRRSALNALDRTRAGRALREPERIDALLEDWLRAVWAPAVRDGARVVAEKTPQNARAAHRALKAFPTSRVVVTVRDPRAVVASLLAVGRRLTEQGRPNTALTRDLVSATREMARYVPELERLAARDDGRALLVRYEALVCEPEATMREVCRFLDLPFVDAVVHPTATLGEGQGGDGAWYSSAELNRDPDPSRLAAWRDRLTPLEQAYVGRVLDAPLLYPDDPAPAPALGGVDRVRLAAMLRAEAVRHRVGDRVLGIARST